MKALVINPVDKSLEPTEIDSQDDIVKLIGFDTVIADDVGSNGDQLYFDEECFLRGTEGRFQLDKLIPVSGTGVIVGSAQNGELSDMQSDVDDIKLRIKFL